MPIPYLNNKTWPEISREERLFCAALFFAVRSREPEFVTWLSARPGMKNVGLDSSQPWELAYEVCFYRDLLYSKGKGVRATEYHDKRTFDLCLFSPSHLVIIEAKAQGPFDSKQNADFERDRTLIPQVLEEAGIEAPAPQISVIALAASRYFHNVMKHGVRRQVPTVFDGYFSWLELFETFEPLPAFQRADDVYKK